MQRLCNKYTVSSKVKFPPKIWWNPFRPGPPLKYYCPSPPLLGQPTLLCSICSAHFLSVVSLPHKFRLEKIKKEKVYIFILKLITTMQLDDISSLHSTSQRIFLQYEIITWECEN